MGPSEKPGSGRRSRPAFRLRYTPRGYLSNRVCTVFVALSDMSHTPLSRSVRKPAGPAALTSRANATRRSVRPARRHRLAASRRTHDAGAALDEEAAPDAHARVQRVRRPAGRSPWPSSMRASNLPTDFLKMLQGVQVPGARAGARAEATPRAPALSRRPAAGARRRSARQSGLGHHRTLKQLHDACRLGAVALRAGADEAALERQLGDLDGVQRGALEQVVADDEEVERARVGEVAAHAADGARRGRPTPAASAPPATTRFGNASSAASASSRSTLALERRADRDRVADHDRHAHAGRRDRRARGSPRILRDSFWSFISSSV